TPGPVDDGRLSPKAPRREPVWLAHRNHLRDTIHFRNDGGVVCAERPHDAQDGARLPTRPMHVTTDADEMRDDSFDGAGVGVRLHDDHHGAGQPIKSASARYGTDE